MTDTLSEWQLEIKRSTGADLKCTKKKLFQTCTLSNPTSHCACDTATCYLFWTINVSKWKKYIFREDRGLAGITYILWIYPCYNNDSIWNEVHPESEKPCQRVSNADRKVFANPESICDMFIIGWSIIWIIWKMSGCYTKYPKKMQSVQMIWKLSGQS